MSREQNETADDVYLGTLVDFLDKPQVKGSSLTVTLLIGGTPVCGELIGRDQWQEELQALLKSVGGSGEDLGLLFKAVEERNRPNLEGPLSDFVHLRKALVITNYRGTLQGDVPQGIEHALWRGRLSEVQGWSLGRPA